MRQPRLSMEGKTLEQFIIDVLAPLREANGLTVAELARRSGIGESQLGKVLRKERVLKADEFIRLCFVLRARGDLFLPVELESELAELNYRAKDGTLLLPGAVDPEGRVPHA